MFRDTTNVRARDAPTASSGKENGVSRHLTPRKEAGRLPTASPSPSPSSRFDDVGSIYYSARSRGTPGVGTYEVGAQPAGAEHELEGAPLTSSFSGRQPRFEGYGSTYAERGTAVANPAVGTYTPQGTNKSARKKSIVRLQAAFRGAQSRRRSRGLFATELRAARERPGPGEYNSHDHKTLARGVEPTPGEQPTSAVFRDATDRFESPNSVYGRAHERSPGVGAYDVFASCKASSSSEGRTATAAWARAGTDRFGGHGSIYSARSAAGDKTAEATERARVAARTAISAQRIAREVRAQHAARTAATHAGGASFAKQQVDAVIEALAAASVAGPAAQPAGAAASPQRSGAADFPPPPAHAPPPPPAAPLHAPGGLASIDEMRASLGGASAEGSEGAPGSQPGSARSSAASSAAELRPPSLDPARARALDQLAESAGGAGGKGGKGGVRFSVGITVGCYEPLQARGAGQADSPVVSEGGARAPGTPGAARASPVQEPAVPGSHCALSAAGVPRPAGTAVGAYEPLRGEHSTARASTEPRASMDAERYSAGGTAVGGYDTFQPPPAPAATEAPAVAAIEMPGAREGPTDTVGTAHVGAGAGTDPGVQPSPLRAAEPQAEPAGDSLFERLQHLSRDEVDRVRAPRCRAARLPWPAMGAAAAGLAPRPHIADH